MASTGMHLEILLRHIPRQMRLGKPARQEERLVMGPLELGDRPVDDLDVVHLRVVHVQRAPGGPGGLRQAGLSFAHVPGPSRSRRLMIVVPRRRVPDPTGAVEDLAATLSGVAMRPEMLHQSYCRRQLFPKLFTVPINAGARRGDAGQQADAGGVAERRRGVGLAKRHAPPRQTIDIGRSRLRVSSQVADPIVEVIYGDEEDIRSPAAEPGPGRSPPPGER